MTRLWDALRFYRALVCGYGPLEIVSLSSKAYGISYPRGFRPLRMSPHAFATRCSGDISWDNTLLLCVSSFAVYSKRDERYIELHYACVILLK